MLCRWCRQGATKWCRGQEQDLPELFEVVVQSLLFAHEKSEILVNLLSLAIGGVNVCSQSTLIP